MRAPLIARDHEGAGQLINIRDRQWLASRPNPTHRTICLPAARGALMAPMKIIQHSGLPEGFAGLPGA
jgi:hypothetical protein